MFQLDCIAPQIIWICHKISNEGHVNHDHNSILHHDNKIPRGKYLDPCVNTQLSKIPYRTFSTKSPIGIFKKFSKKIMIEFCNDHHDKKLSVEGLFIMIAREYIMIMN